MKRILLALIVLTALYACDDQVCKISGTITDPVDTVRLVSMSGDVLDAAVLKNGSFSLKCDINPETGVSIIRGEDYDPIALIPDSKKITVTMNDGTPKVSGSPMSEEIQGLQQWLMKTFFEGNDKMMALQAAGDTIGAEAAGNEMSKQIADYCREVYMNHKSDAIGVQPLGIMMNFIEKDEFIELYEQGGNIVKEDAEIGGYYESLKLMPEESVITLLENNDIAQEQSTFEDYVGAGKYTLVDFWASWCGPCRAETPFVVAAFEKYRDRLNVIGVPVNDKRDATIEAMRNLGIHYPQVLDPTMRLAELFGITGIPYIILFDPEGNIVAQGLRKAQIEEAINKVLL